MSPTAINPNTGKSNADVMASSNEVAARAAAMIGGTWQNGTFDESGKGIGGKFTPRVVSSDSVLGNRDSGEAVNAAGNALTATGGGQTGLTSMFNPGTDMNAYQTNVMNTEVQNQIGRVGEGFSALDAVDASFDARLGRLNQQYRNQMQDLKSSFEGQKQMATQQAAALNPYSNAQGAMTARNFTGAIESKYQEQAQRMTEAADIAQQELEAGRYGAYTEIQNAMEESNRQFKSNMAKFMLDAQQQFNAAQQQEREFGLDVARFGLQEQQFGESRFMDFVNTFGSDPQLQSSIDMFRETGQITEDLLPIVERGRAIGLTPEQALLTAGQETLAQRQQRVSEDQFREQMNLRWAEFNDRQNERIGTLLDEQADFETKENAATSELLEVRSKISELLNDPALDLAVGPNWFARIGGGVTGLDTRIELLASEIGATLTVDNLNAMSGVLTDKDVEILRQAAGAEKYTRFDQNFEDYKSNLSSALLKIDQVLSNNGVSAEQAIQFGMVDPEAVGYANELWGDNQSSTISSYFNE